VLEFFGKRLGYMQEVQREERGFTLIELLVVVAIIGVLVAIALPVFLGQRAKAEDARAQANVREAATAINVFYTENDAAPTVAPGSPYPDAGVPLAGSGFSGSNPDVKLVATGTAATANWCVSTPGSGRTIGGVAANFWFQTETGGTPEHAAALPADC
jgi:prepilin-type N-terminal cleavage/methylation domain-containing protein